MVSSHAFGNLGHIFSCLVYFKLSFKMKKKKSTNNGLEQIDPFEPFA